MVLALRPRAFRPLFVGLLVVHGLRRLARLARPLAPSCRRPYCFSEAVWIAQAIRQGLLPVLLLATRSVVERFHAGEGIRADAAALDIALHA